MCIKRSLFKREWIPVVPYDFSHYGMGIQTDEVYGMGDEVCLSLELFQEGEQVTIPSVKGIVRYKEKHHSRFNYGVEFTFSSKLEKLSVNKDLKQIEFALLQFESSRSSETNGVSPSKKQDSMNDK